MIHTQDPDFTLYHGDAIEVLRTLDAGSVHCCVTSPPYWGLRDYGHDGQLGLEQTPDEYVARMVDVFAEVRRVLRDDGTLWLNLGDSYVSVGSGIQGSNGDMATRTVAQVRDRKTIHGDVRRPPSVTGLAPKQLVGIPWRVAFALQADGWWLRSDIIWSKPNPMPESVTDRPTKSHEYVFLLSKSAQYYYDADAIAEPATYFGPNGSPETMVGGFNSRPGEMKGRAGRKQDNHENRRYAGFNDRWDASEANGTAPLTRNSRSVWEIATQPYAGAHFATFPLELPRRCIKAGSPIRGTVLDPFMGSGTTALVARQLERTSIGIELNADYCDLSAKRLSQQSLLTNTYHS